MASQNSLSLTASEDVERSGLGEDEEHRRRDVTVVDQLLHVAADACDLGLCMVFESRQALMDYNAHPEHLKIKDMLTPLRVARSQTDFETAN